MMEIQPDARKTMENIRISRYLQKTWPRKERCNMKSISMFPPFGHDPDTGVVALRSSRLSRRQNNFVLDSSKEGTSISSMVSALGKGIAASKQA